MVANLFDFHYINYRFRSTEDLNCAKVYQFMFHLQATEKQNTYGETSIGANGRIEKNIVNEG